MAFPNAPSPLSYGPPLLDFSALGDLGNQYYKGAEDKRKYDLSRAFQGGIPKKPDGSPDIAAMTEALARHGAVDLPQMQDQADRAALQPGGPAFGTKPAPQQPAPVPAAALPSDQPSKPPQSGGIQNEGSLEQNAQKGESLRTLAAGLSGGKDISPLIPRWAAGFKIDPDAPLTAQQEAALRPVIGRSIEALRGASGQEPPASAPQQVSQGPTPPSPQGGGVGNAALAASIARASGYPDVQTALSTASREIQRLSGNPRAKDHVLELRDMVSAIRDAYTKTDAQANADRTFANVDRSFAEQKRQFDVGAEGGKVPAGYERTPAGGLQPISGGPEDPTAQLKPVKIGSTMGGRDIFGVRNPKTGAIDIIDPQTGKVVPAGSKLPDEAGDNVTGEDFLKTVPAEVRQLVKKIASYETDPRTLSTKGGHREEILGMVARYAPEYDMAQYPARAAAVRDFSTGKQGNAVRSFDVAIDHLHTLGELARAMDNGDVRVVNAVRNKIKDQLGYDAPSNFDAAKSIVSSEITKAIVGGNSALADREEIRAPLNNSKSFGQLAGVIDKVYKPLMAGQLLGLKKQYEDTTRLKNFDDKLRDRTKQELLGGPRQSSSAANPASPEAPGAAVPPPPPGFQLVK